MLNRLYTDFGISEHAYSWFKTYLHNRFLSVSINGATSNKLETKYGVPQGSCLGPLLFILCTSKLFKIIEHHLPNVHAYADDAQLYISFNASFNDEQLAAVQAMESYVADIREWMLSDRLKLNDDKTEFVIIGTRQQLAKVNIDSLTVGDSTLAPSSEVKNLGCWLDNQLKMDKGINKVCQTTFNHLYNIRKIRRFLSPDCTQTLINAFVTTRLDYCNSLLYGLPAYQLQKLQRVQNAAARIICNVKRFDHITPSLFNLHWLPIRRRIQFKILLLCYKALNGQAPDYISELLKHKIPSRYSLRTNDDRFLLQRTTLRTLSSLRDRSFTVAGPKLWKSLPLQIWSSTKISTFKRQLKTYLFRKAYN